MKWGTVLCVLCALCGLNLAALADEPLPAVATNEMILSSNVKMVKAWTRQAVMVRPDKTIIDPSRTFVDAATMAAQSNTVDKIAELSSAAKAGMEVAVGALTAVTNQVPDVAYHVTVTIPPPAAPSSLMGFVVKETTDGSTDTQWVWYSHNLARKPTRHVVYKTPQGEFSQDVEWVNWDGPGEVIYAYGRIWHGCKKCTIPRPTAARGISAVTRLNEAFGDKGGFSFDGMIVTVGGRAAITTNLVNAANGATLLIENGFVKKESLKETQK